MTSTLEAEYVETIVIGGGQAGLAAGYHLRRHGRPFLILDAGERVGDSWRDRWDSLRLFTPAHFSRLPGMNCGSPIAPANEPVKLAGSRFSRRLSTNRWPSSSRK